MRLDLNIKDTFWVRWRRVERFAFCTQLLEHRLHLKVGRCETANERRGSRDNLKSMGCKNSIFKIYPPSNYQNLVAVILMRFSRWKSRRRAVHGRGFCSSVLNLANLSAKGFVVLLSIYRVESIVEQWCWPYLTVISPCAHVRGVRELLYLQSSKITQSDHTLSSLDTSHGPTIGLRHAQFDLLHAHFRIVKIACRIRILEIELNRRTPNALAGQHNTSFGPNESANEHTVWTQFGEHMNTERWASKAASKRGLPECSPDEAGYSFFGAQVTSLKWKRTRASVVLFR